MKKEVILFVIVGAFLFRDFIFDRMDFYFWLSFFVIALVIDWRQRAKEQINEKR